MLLLLLLLLLSPLLTLAQLPYSTLYKREGDWTDLTFAKSSGIVTGVGRAGQLVNVSSDVFERCTSTGSGLFSCVDSGFGQIFGQIVSIVLKTLKNTNLVASRCFKMKKTSLPVDVRRSKNAFAYAPYWPTFSLPPLTVPDVFAKVN